MDIIGIILAAAVVGGAGILIGIFLGVFGEKFKVEINEREVSIREQLPGNNCGGCGYAGCDGLAAAIEKGEAAVDACPVGGKAVGDAIGKIMGVDASASVRKTAFVKCAGDCDKAVQAYEYYGNETCGTMEFLPNKGDKGCTYGCLGYGACVDACPFDAIHIENGIAVVDKNACKACGKCVAACPRHLIELVPYDAKYLVRCSSKDKGKEVKKQCEVGCIACHLCEKNCPVGAVTVTDQIAHIDTETCISCGACANKCPAGIITGKN